MLVWWRGNCPGMAREDDNARERDDAFETSLAGWDRRLAEATDQLDAAAPSAAVWDRISARVDHLEASRATLTVAQEQGVWENISPGVYQKLLHVDAAAGWRSLLVRVEPGGGVAPHGHPMLEECLVLEGEFEIEGQTVRKGDLHLGFPGHDHAALVSRTGALLYIRGAIEQ